MVANDGKQSNRPCKLPDIDRTAVHRLCAIDTASCARSILKIHLVTPGQVWSVPQASEIVHPHYSVASGRCEAMDCNPWPERLKLRQAWTRRPRGTRPLIPIRKEICEAVDVARLTSRPLT